MVPDSVEVVEKLKSGVSETTDKVQSFWDGVREFYVNVVMTNVPKIILMIVLLWLGWYLVNRLTDFIKKLMIKRDTDVSLRNFLGSLINILLKVVLVMTIMSMVGVQIASFVALLGSVGLAIGMALQGTLQNFAGGVIILLLKPFKVGDFIEQGSFSGTVNNIQIFNTYLTTPDNKVIIIPNSQLATNSLINYTRSDCRRLDIPVGIPYGEGTWRTAGPGRCLPPRARRTGTAGGTCGRPGRRLPQAHPAFLGQDGRLLVGSFPDEPVCL